MNRTQIPPLRLEAAEDTPEVTFNEEQMAITVNGNCYPANPEAFFAPIFSWMTTYMDYAPEAPALMMNLHINYINSSSYKYLIRLFTLLSKYQKANRQFIVNWYYWINDPEIQELGEMISSKVELQVNLVSVS